MADAVTSQILFDGNRQTVMKFTNISDGTGETNVVKVNVSALASYQGKAYTAVDITKVFVATHGMEVVMRWEAATPVNIATFGPNIMNTWDMKDFGGIYSNAAASGKTGNITFTTLDASAGDAYTVILVLKKVY